MASDGGGDRRVDQRSDGISRCGGRQRALRRLTPERQDCRDPGIDLKLLSKEGACFYQLLVNKQKGFPFKLFRAAADPGLYESIVAESCEASCDDYSNEFIRKYPGPELPVEGHWELAMVAMSAKRSTPKLESLNATIRRHLVSSSAQTAKPDLGALSASLMLGRVRRREKEARCPVGGHEHVRRVMRRRLKRQIEGPQPKKARRGGGGAWRAFISKRCRHMCRAVCRSLSIQEPRTGAEERTSRFRC